MEGLDRTIKCVNITRPTILKGEGDWRKLHPHGPIVVEAFAHFSNIPYTGFEQLRCTNCNKTYIRVKEEA